jgi:ClpP class serine protease
MTTPTEQHPAPRVLRAVMAEPWAILPGTMELVLEIAGRMGDPEALASREGQPLKGTRAVTVRDGVAVLPITGPIFPRAGMFSVSSDAVSVQTLALDLRKALDDPAVAAVLLHIDSPGGQVSGIREFAAMVADARAEKPVWAYVQGTGASAAYWIAAATSRIVASPAAVIGSIGVVAAVPKSDGKSVTLVSTRAPKKRLDPETEDGRAEILMTLDDLAGVFVADVAAYRGTTPENVEQNFGQGGVLVGARAVAAGLADALGSLESVIAELSAPRPLAGNLNAMEEQMDPTAKKPENGGGTTAALPPANPAAPAVLAAHNPATPSEPTAADVLVLVGALCGPEARAQVEGGMAKAGAYGVSCAAYAAMAADFGAAQACRKPVTAEQPKAVELLAAALADPAGPGTVVPGQKPSFAAYAKAQYAGREGK